MVAQMIEHLLPDEKKIAHALRVVIMDAVTSLREKLSYGVPYFSHNSRICFIWPASIPKGGHSKGVSLGFCKGYLMADEEGLLQANGRKEVRNLTYLSTSDINPLLVRRWIHEAFIIDQVC